MTTHVDADEDILTGLDFEYVPACESIDHEEFHASSDPAWALIRITADCGYSITGLICKSGWDLLHKIPNCVCPKEGGCGKIHSDNQWTFNIIRLVDKASKPL